MLGIDLLDHLVIGNKTYTSIFTKIVEEIDQKTKKGRIKEKGKK